jgi:16S rRNA (cytidine1402-2'-O)-methyltransferase
LVRRAAEVGIVIVPIPGPSALTAAISASGLPANSVLFLGFLPRQQGERLKLLESLAHSPHTTVIFESPRRMRRTLEDLFAAWGDRTLAVARELTKVHEEVFRGSVSRAMDHFTQPRGEFTLVVEGGKPREVVVDEAYINQELSRLKEKGLRAKEAVGQVAGALDLPRRQVYQQWLALGKEPPS